jgi:NAD(P)-dependent dehydrogenase (short-subunit alcohol dehydrogenase family)
MKNFTDRVCVISGAGSGLGRALALQLRSAGGRLALCDINFSGLEETRQLAGDSRTAISLHRVDVTDRQAMEQFSLDVVSEHGQVDLLINNAGISLTPAMFEDISDAHFQKVIDINMWGVYNGIRAFLPYLRRQAESGIVNISSLAGLVGLYGYSPYAMSKFAIRGLSEALQSELSGTGISVLLVHPGGIKTNIIRNAPNLLESERETAHQNFEKFALMTPDDAAAQILRAIRRKKRSLILGTDAKLVNSIRQLFPNSFPAIVRAIFSRSMFKGDE